MKKKGMEDHDVNNRYVNHGALWEFHSVHNNHYNGELAGEY